MAWHAVAQSPLSSEYVRQCVPGEIGADEAEALAAWYAALSAAVAAFAGEELRQVEPPLRSVPR